MAGDTTGSRWESKIPASAVYVERDGDLVLLSEILPDLDGGEVTVSWDDIDGKPETFIPASHTHTISDIEGLQDALDGKADA